MKYSLWLSLFPVSALGCLIPLAVKAQVTPDGTTSTTVNQDGNNFIIEQGDRINDNLFHSFNEFSVPTLGSATFNNAGDIASIFSRVTGSSVSSIDGLLSANGAANLYLINPNGIIFGQNARLDLGGSFFASTADSLLFEGDTEFSAVNPQAPPLLEVSIPIGARFRDNAGDIVNRGNLSVEQDFNLSGGNLDLEGQLQSGGDLTLQATNTVQIRDSADNPFIAAANGQLLVQGNQNVDIFALNHPNSGLFSGSNLLLRSANAVGGDAQYWSGGDFRIEQLDGNLGDLSSPYDPIIRVQGDLTFNNYLGSSLHILAGGSVVIPGTVVILDVDTVANTISENITLSDQTVVAIDGNASPTLDIRAGVEPSLVDIADGFEQIGAGDFLGGREFFTTPTSAEISIGNVIIEPPNGQVLITNQYRPNTSLAPADITITGEGITRLDATRAITGIDARGFGGDGSSVILDSRGSILLFEDASINSSSEIDVSGNIKLLAVEDIMLDSSALISAFSDGNQGGDINVSSGNEIRLGIFAGILTTNGGDIQLQANLMSMKNTSQVGSFVNNSSDGGDIQLNISEKITIDGGNIGTLATESDLADEINELGDSGNIIIDTNELEIIGFSTPAEEITVGFLSGGDITSDVSGNANAGDIAITASKIKLSNGAQIRASTFGQGDTGNITIKASDSVEVTGIILESNDPSKIATTVNPDARGNGKDLMIETNRLIVSDGAQIQAGVFGMGQGGNIDVNATQSVEISDAVTDENPTGLFTGPEGEGGTGKGGNINIKAPDLSLLGEDSQISNEVDSDASGDAGNTFIKVERLVVEDGARISNATFNTGKGGNLEINASESVDLFGTGGIEGDEEPGGLFTSATFGFAEAGSLTLNTSRLSIRGGASITASTFGLTETGKSGSITINASESIEVVGTSESGRLSSNITSEAGRVFNFSNSSSLASGGSITILTKNLTVEDTAEISTQTLGSGNAGSLSINASEFIELTDGSLRTRTRGSGNAGNLDITTGRLTITGDAEATAATEQGEGKGGNLSVNASESVELSGIGGLGTLSNLGGDAGNIDIETKQLIVRDGAGVRTSSIGSGKAGNLEILTSDSVRVSGGQFVTGSEANDLLGVDFFEPGEEVFISSQITTESSSLPENPAGDLFIQTGQLIVDDGGAITTRTLGSNPGGSLNIIASESVEVSGTSTSGDFSSISAQTIDDGDAGNITLETQKLTVRDSAQISADTSGAGKAGTLTIFADDSVQLAAKGGFLVQAIEGSTAGNLNLQTGELTISDGGFINVSSLQGQAGNLNIKADSLFQNQGQITAETGRSQGDIGANINLEISDIWRIENGSQVSATAFNDADGGNININQDISDTEFLLFAFPPTDSGGSDITANAEQGDGGRIDITAAGVFGIEFRDIPQAEAGSNSLNDFSVSSQFGSAGETIINTPEVDPTSGLINLPASVGDASDQISQNPCEQGVGSEFTITGKGGLPPNVNEALNSESAQVGLIETVPSPQQKVSANNIPSDNSIPEAVPAMGWVFNDKGEVTLTAYSTSDNEIQRAGQKQHRTCSSRNTP